MNDLRQTDKCGMPVNYSGKTQRGWFRFFAKLLGIGSASAAAKRAIVFDDAALEARPSPTRKLSQRAEVNRFWNPEPARKRAS